MDSWTTPRETACFFFVLTVFDGVQGDSRTVYRQTPPYWHLVDPALSGLQRVSQEKQKHHLRHTCRTLHNIQQDATKWSLDVNCDIITSSSIKHSFCYWGGEFDLHTSPGDLGEHTFVHIYNIWSSWNKKRLSLMSLCCRSCSFFFQANFIVVWSSNTGRARLYTAVQVGVDTGCQVHTHTHSFIICLRILSSSSFCVRVITKLASAPKRSTLQHQ